MSRPCLASEQVLDGLGNEHPVVIRPRYTGNPTCPCQLIRNHDGSWRSLPSSTSIIETIVNKLVVVLRRVVLVNSGVVCGGSAIFDTLCNGRSHAWVSSTLVSKDFRNMAAVDGG